MKEGSGRVNKRLPLDVVRGHMAMKWVALNCLMANKKPFVNVRDAVILETYLHFLAIIPLYRAHLIFFAVSFVGFLKLELSWMCFSGTDSDFCARRTKEK